MSASDERTRPLWMRIAVLPDAATAHATASQFAPDGAVLNGPALAPLAEAKAPAAKRRA